MQKKEKYSFKEILKRSSLICFLHKKAKAFIDFDVKAFFMFVTFQYFPGRLYLWTKDERIPQENQRFQKKMNSLDEFPIIDELSCNLSQMNMVNVVMRGVSFNQDLAANLEGSVFLVNPRQKLDRKDVYYATADWKKLDGFIMNDMFPIFYVNNLVGVDEVDKARMTNPGVTKFYEILRNDKRNILCTIKHKSHARMCSIGGVLPIAALGQIAKKVNIFGWDCYMNMSPKEMGYWELLRKLNCQELKYLGPKVAIPVGVCNFHYAIRFNEVPSLVNYGYTNDLCQIKGLNKKLERIFYC